MPTNEIQVGSRLRVTSTSGGHGFPTGAIGRVIPVDSTIDETTIEWKITTRDGDSDEWESGVCAWVEAQNSELVTYYKPTTDAVTTPSVTVVNGDKLEITSTDGNHGFGVGTVVRVIPSPMTSATEWLVTTRNHDSTEWESGVCAWACLGNVEKVLTVPDVKIGDALVVTHTGTHGFPVGTLGRVAATDTDLAGKAHWKMTTRDDLDHLAWDHGVCAWVNTDNAERITTLPVKETTPDVVTPDDDDDVVSLVDRLDFDGKTLSAITDTGTPKKGYRYELLVARGGFTVGCIVTVTGNYFGVSDMEVTDMVDFEAACARGWSFSREPGNIVRNVYYSDVRRIDGEIEFETFTDKDVVTVEVTTPGPVETSTPIAHTYVDGDLVSVLFSGMLGPDGKTVGYELYMEDFTPGMKATVRHVYGQLGVVFSQGDRKYVTADQITPCVEPVVVAPDAPTYNIGDEVAVLFNGHVGPNGEQGCPLFVPGFEPGMKATLIYRHAPGSNLLSVRFHNETEDVQFVKPSQIAPWVDPTPVDPTVEDDTTIDTAEALAASRTQALLDFQDKVRAVILDTDGLDDQDADDMLDRLGLASRWPVGFPSTKQSIVKLTSGNIAVRGDDDWTVFSLTGEGLIYSGYSDAETAKEFDSVIYTAPAAN